MATAVSKIILSASRDIPFNKLLISLSNVRRIQAGVSIEELAEDIPRRTLLQSLTVRPVCDAHGAETGMLEIPAGGHRCRLRPVGLCPTKADFWRVSEGWAAEVGLSFPNLGDFA